MNRMTAEPTLKLYTPGPVNVPNRVAVASSYVNYHHRTVSFSAVLMDMLDKIRPLFGTKNSVLPIHTTGRGALEGVYNDLLSPEDKIICVCNGNFGQMTAGIIAKMGIPSVRCFDDWTQDVDFAVLERLITDHGATAIVVVHGDTSNAIANPLAEIGKLAKKYNLLFIVDAVSTIGCMPFLFDEWGVDAVVTASQKGLMSPPGLSFAVLSEKAWAANEKIASRASYIDIRSIKKSLAKSETPGTTPVSIVLAVNEAVQMIHEEGVEQVFNRHRALSLATKQALETLSFPLFPLNCVTRSDSLTVAALPDCMKGGDIVSHLSKKYNILIGKGLEEYANSTIRIAHMGSCSLSDMLLCITALEATLYDLGYVESIGRGTQSFLNRYNELTK